MTESRQREMFYYDPKRRQVRGVFYVGGKRRMWSLMSFEDALIVGVVATGDDKGEPVYRSERDKRRSATLQGNAWHERRRALELEHPSAASRTVRQAAADYLKHVGATRREKTLAMYKATVDGFVAMHGAFAISKISKAHLDSWLRKQKQRGVSNTTVNLDIRQLRAFLNYCVHSEWLDRVPWVALEEETRRDVGTIPREAANALLAYLEKERARSKAVDRIATYRNWWRLVVLEIGTGMRPGEASTRKAEDFDWEKRRAVHVISNEIHHVKKSLERWQPIHPWAVAKLKADWEETKGDKWFLQNPDGSPAFTDTHVISHGLQRMWKKLGYDSANRDWKGAHGFRATLATELFEGGADPTGVQLALGHTQLSTTMGYNRRREEQKRRAIETVDLGEWLEKAGA